ncbi:L-tyrosine 3-hydroxylase [Nocardiopsis algeriensis]|uniref:L-tyrosine 3-hydroxylase n=1 Tax=Nocardiopsis algeriensis TaxID=1478215 RepID=A0A841IQT5_9ACTN|nr:L-tyrosine 3-hydroxylase [Nocardiopsis algeriensis]MBB6120570.1 hypothetical protein [Nocardiopsis algeriensis]
MRAPDEQGAFLPRMLFLPPTGHGYGEDDGAPAAVGALAGEEYDLFGPACEDGTGLFWYRWITGHQVSFLLWRLLGDALERSTHRAPTHREREAMAACVDGYSAMLLYSATVPREHYHTHIRVRMALQHPAFSGAWASDYRPLRPLFRARFPWQSDPSCKALREAIAFNHAMHARIADHLVPDGQSLLQQHPGGTGVSGEAEDLFDNFFMTVRRPVGRSALIRQLNSRIAGIAADLARNGLYPQVEGEHHPVVPESSGDALEHLAVSVLRLSHRAALLSVGTESPLEEAHL